ncbi:MAG: hypothetical protein K2X84_15950 [Beijerinckiaceae bacterium]|nr:hypothetical protein [Beijerinckiaceae bacterium]
MQLATHPAGRALSEARVATHNGYIWPIERARMVDPAAIAERMVEDIGALVNDGGEAAVVALDDLTRQGWLPAQTARHGTRAFALYEAAHRKPKRRITGNRSTVRRPGWGRDAACLAVLALPVAIWARHLLAGMQ